MLKKCIPYLRSKIRKIDSFGHPVNLSLDGEPTYKTALGGIATLFSRLLIIAYFFYEILGVFQKESQIKTTVQNRNLVADKNVYEVNDTMFDMAIQVSFSSGNETRLREFQRYVNFYVSQLDQYWNMSEDGNLEDVWNETIKKLIRCPHTRFTNASEFTSALGLFESFFCVEDMNFQLQGSLSSDFTKQIWVVFMECDQEFLDEQYPGMVCEQNQVEVIEVINDMKITFVMRNHYFDGEEFSGETLKWDHKTYDFALHPDISNNVQIKLSQNYVEKQISILTDMFTESEVFVSHRFSTYYLHDVDGYEYPYLSLILILDEQSTSYERSTKTIVEALSNTGGIIGFILATVAFFIQYFQDFYFNQAVLKQIFLHEKKKFQGFDTQNGHSKEFQFEMGNQSEFQLEQWYQNSSGRSNSTGNLQIKELERVLLRVPFKIKFIHFCRNSIPVINLCKKQKHKRKGFKKYQLYKIGVKALNKEFDIAYIVKQIRTLKFMSQVFLSKYQRKLLPYFQRNLIQEYKLNKCPQSESICNQEKQSKIATYIKILTLQQNLSKDQRIIQHLTSTKAASLHVKGQVQQAVEHSFSKMLNSYHLNYTRTVRKHSNINKVGPEEPTQMHSVRWSNRQDEWWKGSRMQSRDEDELHQESHFDFEQNSRSQEETKRGGKRNSKRDFQN